ncbi:hypothetical protein BD779DRAFT_1682620 [Infundibulicybe gibba]|nr:hypothetical protein BD779DRAFT_1682620 [Infundibulicybe gibba]
MAMTRSKAAAAAAAQPDIATPDDLVTLNWAHFDRSNPHSTPLPIRVSRTLFNRPVMYCRDIFALALEEDCCDFKARKLGITFWSPKEVLSCETVFTPGWTESIDEQKFKDSFEKLPPNSSLARALGELDNDDLVHLVVTADGNYPETIIAKGHDESRDVVPELFEMRHYRKTVSTPGRPPSEAAKSEQYAIVQANPFEAIHDGRYSLQHPIATVAPPIQIFHPIFETFPRLDLMHVLSAIDPEEVERSLKIQVRLSKILRVNIEVLPNDDGGSPNGSFMVAVGNIRIPVLLAEFKRDFGEGNSDPSHQVGLSMRQSWILESREEIRDKCCCPTLMLAGAGASMCVLGGVFTEKFIVQRLTDMMWVGHSSTEEDRGYIVSRKLEDDNSSSPTSRSAHSRFYPYPTSFTSTDGNVVSFAYVKMLEEDPACVTYQAKIMDEADSPDIVVKFVTRYGEEVHEFLADHDHAPKLWYCGSLDINLSTDNHVDAPSGLSLGPMRMIVIDYIPTCKKPPSGAREQLRAILDLLHSNGYVLGDLRRQNLLFDQGGKVQIIDLDWAGRYDNTNRAGDAPDKHGRGSYVCYPLNLSKSIKWAKGVRDLAPIRPEHDTFMLDTMNLGDGLEATCPMATYRLGSGI